MVTITREFTSEPSNSKAPGASRHLSLTIDGERSERRFERGVMEIPEGARGVLKIGAKFATGKGDRARLEWQQAVAPVVVTGSPEDVVELEVRTSQRYTVRVTGVRAA